MRIIQCIHYVRAENDAARRRHMFYEIHANNAKRIKNARRKPIDGEK